jgi:hypothetical protein
VQPCKVDLTIAPPQCFKCGEAGHKMASCRKGDCYEKELCIDSTERVDDNLFDIQRRLTYDVGKECEVYAQGNVCPLLVVRAVCFTPRKAEGED